MPDNFHGNQWKILPKWRSHVHAFCRFARDSACFCHLCARLCLRKAGGQTGSHRPMEMDRQRQNGGGREVTLDLKQDGEKLTGSISGMGFGGDTDITDGTFKDGQITFKVTRSRGGQDITTTYTGKLSKATPSKASSTPTCAATKSPRVGSAPCEGRRAETGKLNSSSYPFSRYSGRRSG